MSGLMRPSKCRITAKVSGKVRSVLFRDQERRTVDGDTGMTDADKVGLVEDMLAT